MEETGRRVVHKPDLVVEDEKIGLLETDETMTNQEFSSIFYNTQVYNENDGRMVFDAEVINKFKRVLRYQELLEPVREKIIVLQFEKYFEDSDVDRENSKQMNLSLFGSAELANVTVYASKENGEYVYVACKTFRRMLKALEDNTIQFLRPADKDTIISLRLWAFDNDFDLIFKNENLEINFHNVESDESTEETDDTSSKSSSKRKQKSSTEIVDMVMNAGAEQEKAQAEAIKKVLSKDTKAKARTSNQNSTNSGTLTKDEYDSIFITNYIESENDIEIKPSVIQKAEKLIDNMEQVKTVRERFSFHNISKFVDEDLNIDNLICNELDVFINERSVCKFKVYSLNEDEDSLYINLYSFKLLLTRAGSYYSIYLKGDTSIFVNLKKWADESCGEIDINKKSKTMKIMF